MNRASTRSNAKSVKARGRHRAKGRRTERYVWLGAGAVTFGVGAALASGAGVATADAGSDSAQKVSARHTTGASNPSPASRAGAAGPRASRTASPVGTVRRPASSAASAPLPSSASSVFVAPSAAQMSSVFVAPSAAQIPIRPVPASVALVVESIPAPLSTPSIPAPSAGPASRADLAAATGQLRPRTQAAAAALAAPASQALTAPTAAASASASASATSIPPASPGRTRYEWRNVQAFAAVKDDGSVVTWGSAPDGGDSSAVAGQLTGVTDVYSTYSAFAAVKDDGSVVTWGVASDGGDSSAVAGQLTGVTDIYSTSTAFAALKDDGSVVTWGSHGGYSGDVAEQLAGGVTDIYSTQSAFAALKSDGSVVTWGFSGGDSSAVAEQLASGVAFLASPFHSTPSSGGDTGGGGGTGGGDTGGGGTGGGGDGRSILFNSASDSGFFGDLSRGLGLAGIANTIGEVFNLGHSPALGFVNNVRGVIAGVQDIVTGVATRDFGTLLNGILDTSTGVVGLVVKTPVGLALTLSASLAKLYASFWVPIGNTEQMDFLNFIGQCKFHKGTDELNGSEATQISNRYSGFLGLGNLMSDYSNYKLRGVHQFFGQTGCP